MKEELVRFVLENGLEPFSSSRSFVKGGDSIFKTRDARAIHTKVLNRVSSDFVFKETYNIWNYFDFVNDFSEVRRRQSFFKSLLKSDGVRGSDEQLRELSKPRARWKPRYDVIVVTEDESIFVKLNGLGCGVQLLVSESDVADLERYDIVQVVGCNDFSLILERLPQSVFLNSVEDVYLERFLEELSGWGDNFTILKKMQSLEFGLSEELSKLLDEIEPLFDLLENREGKILGIGEVEKILEKVNEDISSRIRDVTISGEGLMKMLGEGKMPEIILEMVRGAILKTGLSEHIFNLQIPVTIDYKELDAQIKRQSSAEFTDLALRIKRNADKLKGIPKILRKLSAMILVEDFCNGVGKWIGSLGSDLRYPINSSNLHFGDARNMFFDNAQPISFQLDSFSRCSILTGANSGGKTTLLEHVLQNISLFNLGLPIVGEIHMPIFSDVYYFAKTKGSASKGAFETLLTQMSKICVNNVRGVGISEFGVSDELGNSETKGGTLILADEIEAVTEPGVAGRIICATAEYFIGKNCFMILATHLGAEISKSLPEGARIDGIEAKGLDENFNLIVDHNPVLGRLAHSTPELIVERMASKSRALRGGGSLRLRVAGSGLDDGKEDDTYFEFLWNRMKG